MANILNRKSSDLMKTFDLSEELTMEGHNTTLSSPRIDCVRVLKFRVLKVFMARLCDFRLQSFPLCFMRGCSPK